MATGGLAGFNFKELIELQKLGTDIGLFITKWRPGPYMPPAGVRTSNVRLVQTLFAQLPELLLHPRRYLCLLWGALSTRTLTDLLIAQAWARLMKQTGIEWIHCHWGDHKLFIGYYCHEITGIPLSVTLHGYDLYASPNWPMLERSLKACAQIVTISNYNKQLLIKRFGALGERVKVIRLFADTDLIPDQLKREVKVLIVGGFHVRKGYDVLLRALQILDRKDLRLWVVGYRGPVDVPKLVSELGLQDRVTVFGQVSDDVVKLLYTYCDIFCMPSKMGRDGIGEGLPVALMEAMSCEKPVVSTFHTGIPELVPDILVRENDPEALAQGIAKLADDPALRIQMGIRNRKIVQEQYSRDNVKSLLAALKVEASANNKT